MTDRRAIRAAERGLTLVELLTAMTIFTVLGLFLFTLTSQSLEIYRKASGGSDQLDRFDLASRRLSEDLRCLSLGDPEGGGPKTRLLATWNRRPALVPLEEGAEVEAGAERPRVEDDFRPGDPRLFMLRFVRTLPGGENGDTVSRFAGTYADQEAFIDGEDDRAESRADFESDAARRRLSGQDVPPAPENLAPGLRPTAGLQEVLYFLDREPGEAPGRYTLYRAVRSPVGGPESFFASDVDDRLNRPWIEAHASAVVSGVLRFGLLFWSQNTEDWDAERALDGQFLGSRDHRGAELWWDSTRGLHSEFGLHLGAASTTVLDDDVFPARALLGLALGPEGEEPEAALVGDLGAELNRATISNAGALAERLESGTAYVRIDDEWLAVEEVDGNRLSVRRGARGTAAVRHAAGAPVAIPREFRRAIELPASRSWFSGGGSVR
ncbi:MAG: prepilin-type N-terminal cleavage/methylation domain-containing protein [Planctomycetota bacterium]